MLSTHAINLRAFWTLAVKEYTRCMRVWPQTFLPAMITGALYFFIFGIVLGARIGEMANVPYAVFIVPGFMMTSMIINTYMNVSHSLFGERHQSAHEEYVSSPMSRGALVAGFISGGCVRGSGVGILVYCVAYLMTGIVPVHLWAMLAIAALTMCLFSALGIINALLASRFDDISIVPSFVLAPLTYLGGVFYSVDALPTNLQFICHLNPIYHLISAFRYCMLGQPSGDIASSFVIILLCTTATVWVAWGMARRGIGIQS